MWSDAIGIILVALVIAFGIGFEVGRRFKK